MHRRTKYLLAAIPLAVVSNVTWSSTFSYTSPEIGTHMRLTPTGGGDVCWDDDPSNGPKPVALCPAGEYDVDVWHGGSNGWDNHVYKASETDPVTLGEGGSPTPPSTFTAVAVNTHPTLDFDAMWDQDIDELPFYYLRPSDGKEFGDRDNPDSLGTFTQAEEKTSWEHSDSSGNFRIECQWSHFAYDDPIIFHDDSDGAPVNRSRGPNKSHLHMFWGNTKVDWQTNLVDPDNPNYITKKGGSTCHGLGLNRSSYWMPALMQKESHAVAPYEITIYYKSRTTNGDTSDGTTRVANTNENAVRMPAGLQLITGYGKRPPETLTDETFGASSPGDKNAIAINRYLNYRHEQYSGIQEARPGDGSHDWWTINDFVFWGCGRNGTPRKKFNRIPTQQEWNDYCGPYLKDGVSVHPYLEATMYFPQCRARNSDTLDLKSDNFRDHVRHARTYQGCPTDYPHRMPALGYRIYWDVVAIKNRADADTSDSFEFSLNDLRLSSDPISDDYRDCEITEADHYAKPKIASVGSESRSEHVEDIQRYRCKTTSTEEKVPGGTLHADWVSGWHDDVMDLWLDECNRAGNNCTLGETGTPLALIEKPEDFVPPDAKDYLIPVD